MEWNVSNKIISLYIVNVYNNISWWLKQVFTAKATIKLGDSFSFVSCKHAGFILVSDAHVCFITRRSDPSQENRERWALPIEQRCMCDKIVIAPEKTHRTGTSQLCGFSQTNAMWWFTDVPFSSLQPQIWLAEYKAHNLGCNKVASSEGACLRDSYDVCGMGSVWFLKYLKLQLLLNDCECLLVSVRAYESV